MVNYNQEIINIAEKICEMFDRGNLTLMNDEQRNSFVSEINTFFEVLYDAFKNIPNSSKKDNILNYVRRKQDIVNVVLSFVSELSIEYAKNIVNEMKDYLKDNLSDISIDDGKEYYLSKLAIYNNLIDRHMELEKNYKKRNIKYDMYIGSYNALVSYYKDIMSEYKKISNPNIEKPKNLKIVPKSVDDLLLKDMRQEQRDYLKLYNFYEDEIYSDYVMVAEKYNNSEISKEDYEIAASNCLNHYEILNNEYNRLSKEFSLYEKMFDSEISEYNMATEEELDKFYVELDEYNNLVDEYKKQVNIFDEIVSKYMENLDDYERQMFTLDELYNKLLSRRDKLKKQKEKIYNNTVLNILNKRKGIIMSNLKNNNLTDQDKEKLNTELININERISEINKFKSTLVMKSFKQTEKKVKEYSNKKSDYKHDYLSINKLTEPFFLGDNIAKEVDFVLVNECEEKNEELVVSNDSIDKQDDGNNNNDNVIAKGNDSFVLISDNKQEILDEYEKLIEAYNEQLYAFYEIEKKFLNGEIPYEGKYEKAAVDIISCYKNVKNHYDKVNLENKQKLDVLRVPEKPMISMGNEEKEQKVVGTKIWQWVKDHKKQILIALGLTALAVSIIVLVTQLLPAIIAAAQASETAGMFSQMILNAKSWHTAIASERIALHGANIALANQITTLTGMSNVFNTATGVWTIGGNVLASAATQASLAAGKAASLVTTLKLGTLIPAIGGLGLVGTGLLLKNNSKKKVRSKKNNYNLSESFE